MLPRSIQQDRNGGSMSAPSLTGPEQPLAGRVEPKSDEVIAVFRNGKLVDIFDSGDRARALWMRYRPGSLTYARILRSDIPLKTEVSAVAVDDGWLLPEVVVQTFVALNDAGGYRALRRRLEARGLSYADALTAELDGEMNRFVRTLFADRSHADVISNPTPPGLGARTVLLDGLFVVDSVHVQKVSADPQYSQLRTAVQGRKVDVEEIARDEAVARAHGVTLHELKNPQLEELRLQQEHERALAMAQQSLELERLKVEAERDRLQLQRAELEARGSIAIAAVNNVTALGRAQKSGVLPDLSLGIAGPGPGVGAGAPDPDFVPTIPAPLDELARDPRLMADWRRAGGPGRAVKGLVRVEEDGSSLVLLALDGVASSVLDLPVLVGQAFPGEDVVVLPQSDSLLTWVDALVHDRARRIDDLEPVLTLEDRDDTLRILVGSRSGRAGKVVKAVLDPTTLIVPALCALLPYDDVTCSTALV
jgi:hypothetical protein